MLADRFGRKPVFQWSIVLWGIASYLCSTAQNVETLTLFRVLLGIGMGMEFPIAQSMLSELIPAKRRGRYIALMDGFFGRSVSSQRGGAVVLPAAGDWLARHLSGVGGAGGVRPGDSFFSFPSHRAGWSRPGIMTRRIRSCSASRTGSGLHWAVRICLNRFVCHGWRVNRVLSSLRYGRSGRRSIASAR